jgi:hypothetical protein
MIAGTGDNAARSAKGELHDMQQWENIIKTLR